MNLGHYFDQHFEILSADTDQLREEVLRLRYQVYCIENTLAEKKHFTDCKEQDLYDGRSVHRLIRHKSTGSYVASVRLILTDPGNPESPFPIEEYCGQSFYRDLELLKELRREYLAEVSRFLISKEREREAMEASISTHTEKGNLVYKRKDGLLCYLLLFGLFSTVVRTSIEVNATHWYVGVQMPLLRLFRKFGFELIQIGTTFEYHGLRYPCLGSTEAVLSSIHRYRPELWNFLTQDGTLVHHA